MKLSLRQQYQLKNLATTDEAFVIKQFGVLAEHVHHTKLPKNIMAATYFPDRIRYIQKNGASDDVVEQCTIAYTAIYFWLIARHLPLLVKMMQKVSTLIPPTRQDEAMELLQTMAISILLNYSESKGLPPYKYLAHSLWLKCRSMFKRFQTEKGLRIDSYDITDLGSIAGL